MHNLELARARAQGAAIKDTWSGSIRMHAPRRTLDRRSVWIFWSNMWNPGVSTESLDTLVYEFAMDHGAIPAPLHYRGFPKSICTSLNHVVCHGIPGATGC